MDLPRIYSAFIADRRTREGSLTVFDRRHVVPKCIGGTDAPENLIRLSPSDHLFAHVLLGRIHGGKLAVVAVRMAGMRKYQGRRTRTRYERLREEVRVGLLGNKLGHINRGRPKTEAHKARISAAHQGKKMSEASKQHLSRLKKGGTLTPEHKAKISLGLLGHHSNVVP